MHPGCSVLDLAASVCFLGAWRCIRSRCPGPSSAGRIAGRHFNRGERAFFIALGWFVRPWLLMATRIGVAVVLWRRQFASDSRRALLGR
jgi:hypothetical protein